jgi:hypothetical protein
VGIQPPTSRGLAPMEDGEVFKAKIPTYLTDSAGIDATLGPHTLPPDLTSGKAVVPLALQGRIHEYLCSMERK